MSSDKLLHFQKNYKKDKLRHLFKTKELADCVFICEQEHVPAHKFILAYTSPVFELMFYGPMASSEIDLPDINPGDFKKMLEYVYTEQVDIKSVSNAWNLIYISHKYFINNLLKICINYIKKNLSISCLLISYEYAQLYNQQELVKTCWQDILHYTKGILFNYDYHMKYTTLNDILKQCINSVTNSDLILIAVKWAVDECAIRDVEATCENIWKIFDQFETTKYLNLKEFDAMQYDLKTMLPIHDSYNKLHSLIEFVSMLNFINDRGVCMNKLLIPKLFTYKFRDNYKISKNVIFSNSVQIHNEISPMRPIYLFGIAVSTLRRPVRSENDFYNGCIEIKVTCKNNFFYKCKVMDKCMEYDDVQFVNFPLPLLLEPDNIYQITVIYYSEPVLSRGDVLLYYMDQRLNKLNTVINFSEELEGSIIQAVSFYPT